MCIALVVGNMIGSGIFLLPASLAPYGGISIIGWLITAGCSVVIALIFARLSRMITKTGGPYAYTKDGYGSFPAFLVAWGYWISIWCGNAAISTALVGYLGVFFPVINSSPLLACSIALTSVWFLSWVNIYGIREAGYIQVVTSVLKITPLILIGIFGLISLNADHFTPFNVSGTSSFSAITATAALTLWAFLGLESASIPADHIRNPGKTISKATILGTIIAAAVYIISTTSVMGVINPAELAESNAPFSDAARILWGDWAGYLVAGGAAVSCFGALNGWILLQGQLPRAAALDGLFPKQFSRLTARKTPIFGIIISSLLMTLLLIMNFTKGLVEKFTFIIMLATLATLVPYLFCSLVEWIVRKRSGELLRGKSLVILVTLSGISLLYSSWAVAGLGWEIILWGILLFFLGIPFYLLARKQHNQ